MCVRYAKTQKRVSAMIPAGVIRGNARDSNKAASGACRKAFQLLTGNLESFDADHLKIGVMGR
jgi:hypothetical protein